MAAISIIVALDRRNAIGHNNKLLCHLPGDLKYFKSLTEGHTIIMGRRTFESLPKGALPNRRNVVVTQNNKLRWENVEICASLEECLRLTENEAEVFIIGGDSVYRQAMGMADTLYITQIQHQFQEADAFFPEIDPRTWSLVSQKDQFADEKNKFDYTFLVYKRI